jgi:hypothetical protein
VKSTDETWILLANLSIYLLNQPGSNPDASGVSLNTGQALPRPWNRFILFCRLSVAFTTQEHRLSAAAPMVRN